MIIKLANCQIRSWLETDAESVARYANNKKIWLNLRDAFPHPYTLADAEAFIQMARAKVPETYFAIAKDEQVIGSIGYNPHSDVERVSAEIGYWLGEPFWGQGIMTEALKALTQYAVNTHNLTRVYAVPFQSNQASFRVLEKAGFQMEARMRRSAIKEGKIVDQLLYAYVLPE